MAITLLTLHATVQPDPTEDGERIRIPAKQLKVQLGQLFAIGDALIRHWRGQLINLGLNETGIQTGLVVKQKRGASEIYLEYIASPADLSQSNLLTEDLEENGNAFNDTLIEAARMIKRSNELAVDGHSHTYGNHEPFADQPGYIYTANPAAVPTAEVIQNAAGKSARMPEMLIRLMDRPKIIFEFIRESLHTNIDREAQRVLEGYVDCICVGNGTAKFLSEEIDEPFLPVVFAEESLLEKAHTYQPAYKTALYTICPQTTTAASSIRKQKYVVLDINDGD